MDTKNRRVTTPKLLSVLVPSLRSRLSPLGTILEKIEAQIGPRMDVEVLSIVDLKTMTLGRKRNLLMDMAVGKYLTFVNDDDDISPKWLEIITENLEAAPDVDVLSIRAECKKRTSVFSEWENSHFMATTLRCPEVALQLIGKPGLFIHKPCMWCVWRSDLARTARFPDQTWGEDTAWMHAVCANAKTERVVPSVIYCYYADDTVSEAGPWRHENHCGLYATSSSDTRAFIAEHKDLMAYLQLVQGNA